MDMDMFDDLTQSLREAVATRRGEAPASRCFEVERTDVKAVREQNGQRESPPNRGTFGIPGSPH